MTTARARRPRSPADDHRTFAQKAGLFAARVLPLFARERPDDDRPAQAIAAIRAWAAGRRELGMAEVRRLALAAHAAARAAKTGSARFAARAAGHAIATWHAPTHAMAVPWYAAKAVAADTAERAARRAKPPGRASCVT
ncbi:MAG: hypothetical protein K8W52_45330 [Deltaproteobacteria bacterium]|nr:hypothetical protein [Deltaproteobacteria bacterium]